MRIDKWLWQARFFKSRSRAKQACQSSKIRVNGVIITKNHYSVMAGDILTFALNDNIKVIKISRIGVRRGPSLEAQTLYQDISPANQLEKFDDHLNIKIGEREAGSGRPTKRQRRDIDELMARGY